MRFNDSNFLLDLFLKVAAKKRLHPDFELDEKIYTRVAKAVATLHAKELKDDLNIWDPIKDGSIKPEDFESIKISASKLSKSLDALQAHVEANLLTNKVYEKLIAEDIEDIRERKLSLKTISWYSVFYTIQLVRADLVLNEHQTRSGLRGSKGNFSNNRLTKLTMQIEALDSAVEQKCDKLKAEDKAVLKEVEKKVKLVDYIKQARFMRKIIKFSKLRA